MPAPASAGATPPTARMIRARWKGRMLNDIRSSRYITGPLAILDLGLGGVALAFPDIYLDIMHTGTDGAFMLQRTGVLWLFFCLCQLVAFLYPARLPMFVFLVGMLRLMDVPADIVYHVTSPGVTAFGRFGLVAAPIFNIVAGTCLILFWHRHETGRKETHR